LSALVGRVAGRFRPLPARGERSVPAAPEPREGAPPPRGRGKLKRCAATFLKLTSRAAAIIVVCLLAAGAVWIATLGPAPAPDNLAFSTLVVDREGRLLRPYATGEGRWRFRAQLEMVDPRYVAMLLAYEDKRFRGHHGVDPLALARAAFQWVTSGHVVSGG